RVMVEKSLQDKPEAVSPQSSALSPATWQLRCRVNGQPIEVAVNPTELLYDTLRERLRLTGTKGACLEGECGSCTVLLDGTPMNACLILAAQAQEREILTVEGLAQGDVLHPLQDKFIEFGAVQCGYCTPGLLVMGKALLD